MQAAKVMKPLYNTLQNGFRLAVDETAQWCEIERRCRAINFAPLPVRKRLLVNLINFLAGWRLLNKSGKGSFSSDKLAKDVIAVFAHILMQHFCSSEVKVYFPEHSF